MPPSWISEHKDNRILVNSDNVSLECKADGIPKPNIKWRDSKGLNKFDLFVFNSFMYFTKLGNYFEGETISLNRMNLKGNENFECIADNGVGEAIRKVLIIEFSGEQSSLNFLNITAQISNCFAIQMWRLCCP